MLAGEWPITIEKGATFDPVLTLKTNGGADLVDLSGCTARMHIRGSASGDLIAELTTENGGIVLGGALGTVTLLLTAIQTAAIERTKDGVYDLEIASGAVVRRWVEGPVTFSPEVTHP